MPKKTTTTTTVASRVASGSPAPNGLRLLLSMIDVGNEDDAIYARAQQIVEELHDWRDQRSEAVLSAEASTRLVYPDIEDDQQLTQGSVLKAGVLLGAAVAWILMTDLQGGAR